MVQPKWVRLVHKNGKFAGSYDAARDIIMFVDRQGTVTYDLATLREQVGQETTDDASTQLTV